MEMMERNSHNASYVRQVINSFLECLDGTAGREGVVVALLNVLSVQFLGEMVQQYVATRRVLNRVDSRREGKLPPTALNIAMMPRAPFCHHIDDEFDIMIGK
ncbi:hypothetical protein HJB84_10890 [Rhizobium sp. NZLR1b]|uniref:hypothetical protein n=1 Tax=Rhizobium sp. NZLR1b TaxID=2731099 RepID=UPI001C83C870|nr:hypothetical protein [Rhizobium sp. NZLR1b]